MNNNYRKQHAMATKTLKDFKVIYKNSVKFNGRSVDDNVFTVTILATDAKDAEKKFQDRKSVV